MYHRNFQKLDNQLEKLQRSFSVSSIIKEFDNFSSLSGYKINWSKSALMPINNVKVNSYIPSFIPIKESFIYLGITKYIKTFIRLPETILIIF